MLGGRWDLGWVWRPPLEFHFSPSHQSSIQINPQSPLISHPLPISHLLNPARAKRQLHGMIYAADLTYQEVRTQYVVPLVNELVQKSGLANVINKPTSDPSSTSAVTETLFDDVAASKRGGCTLEMGYAAASSRCYHEVRSINCT